MSADGHSFRGVLAWTVVFGVAFGWVEAVVVIYLREIHYPAGFVFPLVPLPAGPARVELLRELATLAMLLAVARVGAKRGWGRFGLFALAFGVWDLVYYAGLYLALGWPASFGTWDVLFLIPGIWASPVWAPMLVALLLVVSGSVLFMLGEAQRLPRAEFLEWLLAAASLVAILAAFLANHGPLSRGELPGAFPLWPFLSGVLLAMLAFYHLLQRRFDDHDLPTRSPGEVGGSERALAKKRGDD